VSMKIRFAMAPFIDPSMQQVDITQFGTYSHQTR
jgi:hypothetical protein